MFKVIEQSKHVDYLEKEFRNLYLDKPLYYFWQNFTEGKQAQKIRMIYDAWFINLPSVDNWYLEPIKGNQELTKFIDRASPIKYQRYYKGRFSKNYLYPLFIELEGVNCPWIRGGEYDIFFSNRDKFLKYFKEEFFQYSYERSPQGWLGYKEEYQWFGDNFISGESVIRLG
jgi:hypothetical protein